MGLNDKYMDLKQMVESIWETGPYKVILSNGRKQEHSYQKIVLQRLETRWQAEKYTKTQVFHENLSEEEVKEYLLGKLETDFRQCNAWDKEQEHMIRISKGGKASYQKMTAKAAPKQKNGHNRKKNYLLEEGTVIPPLVDMGIFTAEGKVVRSMYDKYRQINRFVEMIEDEIEALPKGQTVHVIDFGCGKS